MPPTTTLPPKIVQQQHQSGESGHAKPDVLQYLCDEQDHLTDAVKSPVTIYLGSLYKSFRTYFARGPGSCNRRHHGGFLDKDVVQRSAHFQGPTVLVFASGTVGYDDWGNPEAGAVTMPPATLPPKIVQQQHQSGESGHAKPDVLQYLCDEQDHLTDAVKSPVTIYLGSLYKSFRTYQHQVVIALVALVIGSLCAWDGPQVWQAIFTASMVAAAASLASIESEAWGYNMASKILLMFQSAFAAGVAVQVGFDGFQVLFGTAVGSLGCFGCGGWARSFDEHVPGIALLWYSIGAVLGALVLTVWQRPVLVTLGPLLGGFLMTTGVVCMACTVASTDNVAETTLLPELDAPWIHIARDLFFATGSAAFAVHGACAVVATLVYRATDADDRRCPAVCCLVAGIMITAVIAAV
eukprot:CAMPEP_0172778232 /NCGR_PEP_ID=MMETSP1074-20121228/201805_1 /TAXON_ID=2916 /ORGANISM="Ceratium fusus, Strain PA161109" /LENGTH=408 /DNA_ID=CAMNT_0013615163 /DNA_START=173 /DNA_END=1397 /DNA_ORIENTATION=-